MDMQGTAALQATVRPADDEEERCRRYGRARLTLYLTELVVLVVVLAGLTLSGAAGALLDWTNPSGAAGWVGHLEYLALLGIIARASVFPFQFVTEYWLDRRYGLCRESFASWLCEWLCRSAVLGMITVVTLFPVAETLRWGLLLALPFSALFLLGRPLFFDYVYFPLLALFYPVRFLRRETFVLPGLGKRTLPVYLVQVSHKTSRANAGIRLRGKKTAIYVSDTLIDEFTDGEERVVMAHEFGHLYDHLHLEERTRAGIAQAHRKLALGSVQLLAGVISLALMYLIAPMMGLEGVHDLRGFPLLAAMTLVLGRVLSPYLCAEARRDERDADEYALAITGDVDNYVSVMRKLRRMNLEESCAGPISRFLFDTHPSYEERVRLAREYRRRHTARPRRIHWRGWRHIQRHGRR